MGNNEAMFVKFSLRTRTDEYNVRHGPLSLADAIDFKGRISSEINVHGAEIVPAGAAMTPGEVAVWAAAFAGALGSGEQAAAKAAWRAVRALRDPSIGIVYRDGDEYLDYDEIRAMADFVSGRAP